MFCDIRFVALVVVFRRRNANFCDHPTLPTDRQVIQERPQRLSEKCEKLSSPRFVSLESGPNFFQHNHRPEYKLDTFCLGVSFVGTYLEYFHLIVFAVGQQIAFWRHQGARLSADVADLFFTLQRDNLMEIAAI